MTENSLPDVSMKKPDQIAYYGLVGAMGIGVIAAGVGLWYLMPYLLELAKDTVYLIALLGVAGFLLLVLAEAWSSRHLLVYKLKMVARNIRKQIVKSDPIGVLDVAVSRFNDRMVEVGQRIVDATAARVRLEKQLTDMKAKAGNEERLAKSAEMLGKPKSAADQHYVSSERWRRAADELQPLLDSQQRRQARLDQARQLCEDGLANVRNQKEVLQVKLEAYQAEAAQARAFKRFFGHNEDLDMIDMAVEEIERQSASCEAEVIELLKQADPMIEREQLQKEADAMRARERLAASEAPKQVGEGNTVKFVAIDKVKEANRR